MTLSHRAFLSDLGPWFSRNYGSGELHKRLSDQRDYHPQIILFNFNGAHVWYDDGIEDTATPGIIARAQLYRDFFRSVVDELGLKLSMTLAIDLEDLGHGNADVPVFAFQREKGDLRPLLPDVDFLGWNFYENINDTVPFDDKECSAVFYGSTTGIPLFTADDVFAKRLQRVNSAEFFRNNPQVKFELPSIVQTDTAETRKLLEAKGHGHGNTATWEEQFRHKFIISIDGNGATCSRVAISLKSQSVLLKYNSQHELFYFNLLRPHEHYIPINQDKDVLDILAHECKNPGIYKHIAENGQAFYSSFLTRQGVREYTANVLLAYHEFYNGTSSTSRLKATQSEPSQKLPQLLKKGIAVSSLAHRTLDQIGVEAGTDKSSLHHGYLEFYDAFLCGLRNNAPKVLEIGVHEGASLRMWSQYFQNGSIIGVDINTEASRYGGGNIEIEIGSQSSPMDLVRIGVKHGPFDLIIDDGSHVWSDQILSLQCLFPFLKRGGYYILEDLQTSYPYDPGYEDYRQGRPESTVQYLTRFTDSLLTNDARSSGQDRFLSCYAKMTQFVAFHYGTSVIKVRN